MLYGIDISNWQEGLDISALPADISFVIVKATEGTGFIDWTFNNFISQIKNKNLEFGFYHFATGVDPEMEADWFVYNTKQYFGKGIPILDWEISPQVDMSDSKWCETFIKRVHDLTGYWCMLYTYAGKMNKFSNTWLPKYCPLWLAGYSEPKTNFEKIYPPYNSNPWHYALIWQFTSSLKINCWSGGLDGNIAYINKADWKNYIGSEDEMLTNEDIAKIWNYWNKDVENRGDAYQIIRSTLDKTEELEKRIEELEKKVK